MPTDPTRVKEIFLQATEFRDEALRITFLDSACSGDSDLRERVEALLARGEHVVVAALDDGARLQDGGRT